MFRFLPKETIRSNVKQTVYRGSPGTTSRLRYHLALLLRVTQRDDCDRDYDTANVYRHVFGRSKRNAFSLYTQKDLYTHVGSKDVVSNRGRPLSFLALKLLKRSCLAHQHYRMCRLAVGVSTRLPF